MSRWSWRRSSRWSRVGLDLARVPQSALEQEAVEQEALEQEALEQEALEQALQPEVALALALKLVLARQALHA